MPEGLTNWGGNIRYSAARVHTPASFEELALIVRNSRRVKALGTRHTFNNIGDTDGDLISFQKLNAVIDLNTADATVTVEPGITYGRLGEYLHDHGYTLRNFPSLPHVCVGGAIQTASHGSGTQNLAADEVGCHYILSPEADDIDESDMPPGGCTGVNLGVFGMVGALTLRIQPALLIQQLVYEHVQLEALLNRFEEVTQLAYSVSLFTDWQTDTVNQLWFKQDVTAGTRHTVHSFLGGTLATRKLHPIAAVDPVNCTEQGSPGPAHERLPHFRYDREPSSAGQELQAEYFVDLADAPAALRAIAAVGPRLRHVLMISEVRTVLGDHLWLSPAYQKDVVGIHFTMKPMLIEVLEALHDVIEPALAPYNPRPHWGKLFTLDPAAVQSAYPMLPKFAEVAKRVDPAGRFSNEFANRYLFGTTV